MRPQKEFPLLDDFKKRFKVTEDTIFAYDHVIYTNNELPDHLVMHELTHHFQQDEHGLDTWVYNYLNDPKFRLEMEVEAYRKQLAHIQDPKGKAITLMVSAKDLSSELYDNLVTYKEALNLLK